MCIYGLSLYFETPKHIRHGRLPYIIISWTIFILFCLSQTGDAVQAFSFLYHGEADDPISILKLRQKDDHTWWRLGSSSCIYLVNWIADGLLVRFPRLSASALLDSFSSCTAAQSSGLRNDGCVSCLGSRIWPRWVRSKLHCILFQPN